MAILEIIVYLVNKPEDIEAYVGLWIFIHVSLIIFGCFRMKKDIVVTGSADQIFGLFASEKVEQISEKPSTKNEIAGAKINRSSLILLGVNVLIYIVLFV